MVFRSSRLYSSTFTREPRLPRSNLVVPTARNIIRFQPGTHDVVLKGISFCGSIGTGIALLQSSRCKLIGLTVSAVGGPSGAGIIVDGGETNSVIGCDVSFTGANGVSLSGGDWEKLESGRPCG